MLWEAIVRIGLALAEGVIALFPTYTLPSSVAGAGAALGAQLASVNGVFPIGVLGVCLGIVLAVWTLLQVVALVSWIYERIPFKAT